MKIIIKESKLEMLMTEYLDTWISNKYISDLNNFILISQETTEDNWTDYMEYDFSDGRLWINNDFKKFMSDLFGKSVLDIIPFITDWFEKKFNVEIKYTE